LEQSQAQLTDFRRKEGLYSSRAQAVMDQTGRAELQLRQAELTGERQIFENLLDRLQAGEEGSRAAVLRTIGVSPSIVANPMIAGAYENLTTYQLQRDSLLTGPGALSRNNRDVEALDSLIVAAEVNLLALTESHIRSLDAQIGALAMVGARVDSAFQHLAATEPEEVRLMLRIEAIGEAAAELRSQFYTAGLAEAALVDEVTILDQALPGQFTGTGPGRSLFLGLLLGLLVGGAAAVVLDSANRSIRGRDEVERVLQVRGLGVIPAISADGSKLRLKLPGSMWSGTALRPAQGSTELVAATAVHSPGAEAYRSVRTNLGYWSDAGGARSVMVTSPSSGEGKTMTAANLAVTFAHQGLRVLLIDADLRRARLHKIFELPREPGLADVLSSSLSPAEAIRQTSVAGLCLLPAGGTLAVSAADLLSGDAMRMLIDALSGDFDIVVVDSPPVLLTADAPILATQVDDVLLIVRAGQTDRETAQYAIHQLVSIGANVAGAVLNDPDSMLNGASAYGAGVYAQV
jgi:capsular exopolysaccharide synthesis family protein